MPTFVDWFNILSIILEFFLSKPHLHSLIESNLHALDMASELLVPLPAERFVQIQRPYFESSLGKHLRHVLDHYICFKRDFEKGLIDYDQRQRDCQLEIDKDYALSTIKRLRQFLVSLESNTQIDQVLQVVMCNDVDSPNGEITNSTLGRELQFLQGHSVHHFALMAAMLRVAGDDVDHDFGVAPSTLVHEKTVKESA